MAALRVAVAGVSGIGKHHAKWYHGAGCRVAAFLGSSAQSCEAAAQGLRKLFPFDGRAYWDWEALLDREKPDIVDICLPNELHFDYAQKALEAGCHVLCEKPLVWAGATSGDVLLERAQSLVDTARRRDLLLGVCTQYSTSLPHYMQLYEPERGSGQPVAQFYAEMETLARGRQRSAADVWVDMGTHPLSLLLSWFPDGVISPASLQVDFSGNQARARFDLTHADGHCRSEVIVRDLEQGAPVRRFGINDFLVDCSGRADAAGIYRSVLSRASSEAVGEDFMSLLINHFVRSVEGGQPLHMATGEEGVRNLAMQVQIMRQAGAIP